MQIRDNDVKPSSTDEAAQERKGGALAGTLRAIKILAFFVVLVVVFVASVMVVAIASGAALGSCSSGSQNPIV